MTTPDSRLPIPDISLELFPPRTPAGWDKLPTLLGELATLRPAFFSVTYGAGGSTRDRTRAIVKSVQESGIAAAPHLSCVGDSKADLREISLDYQEIGIKRIVTLRGDLPSGAGMANSELRYANELVEFIRQETGDHFTLEVAAYPEMHPQAASFEDDLKNFERKVKAGADSAITQYFFNADSYFHFVDRVQAMGIEIPIIPGIMPITNYSKLARFSDACGAEIPRWIRKQLEAYGDNSASIMKFGEEVVSNLSQKLLDQGAPGIHFYTMNQAEPCLAIWDNIK